MQRLTRYIKRWELFNQSDETDIAHMFLDHESRVMALEAAASAADTIVWNEVPSGTLNGINILFILANAPDSQDKTSVYLNGLLMKPGADFILMGAMIWFDPDQIPQPGDNLLVTYAY